MLFLQVHGFHHQVVENLSLAKILQAIPEQMQHAKNGSLNAEGDCTCVTRCAVEFESPNQAVQVMGAAKMS